MFALHINYYMAGSWLLEMTQILSCDWVPEWDILVIQDCLSCSGTKKKGVVFAKTIKIIKRK